MGWPIPRTGHPGRMRASLTTWCRLSLAAPNDATNLWPEVGKPSGNRKDKVENAPRCRVRRPRVPRRSAAGYRVGLATAEKGRLGIGGVVSGTPAPASRPWCTASAAPANDGWAGDYNVNVTSNQPDRDATASDAGDTWGQDTNSSGATTIYLWYTSPGMTIKVTVGGASCSTLA